MCAYIHIRDRVENVYSFSPQLTLTEGVTGTTVSKYKLNLFIHTYMPHTKYLYMCISFIFIYYICLRSDLYIVLSFSPSLACAHVNGNHWGTVRQWRSGEGVSGDGIENEAIYNDTHTAAD